MWLFSSSYANGADASSSHSTNDTTNKNDTVEESSSAIETPQKTYSAVIRSGDINTTAAFAPNKDDSTRQQKRNKVKINNSNANKIKSNKQKGLIYFRPIQPADRTVIQTLHEQWFPVDYKSDFFDTLCASNNNNGNNKQRKIMPGNEPLYCCVACFRELDEDEFEEIRLRKKQREEDLKRRKSCYYTSFWPMESYGNENGDGMDDEEHAEDYLLWELDNNSSIQENDNAPNGTASRKENKNNKGGNTCFSTSYQDDSCIDSDGNTNNNLQEQKEDGIESGESVFSIHHRREREKMKRFYTNGFRFDKDDDGDDDGNESCHGNDINRRNKQHAQNNNAKQSNNNNQNQNEDGPYYNSKGERILGCLIGSFLPSNIPSSKHRSTLDEKLGRDETARILIPDPTRHSQMFYIMTLGTTREARRSGLGSMLVDKVADLILKERQGCGALYLHVITYNEGAIRLYERLGFLRVKQIKDYYTINSVNYDCYLYARYFHGNRGHKTTFDVLYDLASSIVQKLSHALIPSS